MSKELIIKLMILAVLLKVTSKIFVWRTDPAAFDVYFKRYATDPITAKAVARVESNFNPNAVGDGGRAFGLMQIWYATAKGHGYMGTPYGLLDPEINVYYACKELNHLISRYGKEKGIMGYNIGETQLRKGKINQAYLNRVNDALGRITLT